MFLSHFYKLSVTALLYVASAAQAQTISGTLSTLAGNGTLGFIGDGGAAANANLNQPTAAVSAGGNVYIADQVNNAVRVVSSSGTITTFAGTEVSGYSGDGGKATAAQLAGPVGIAVDSSGNVYIADTGNHLVRKVSTSGTISTFAGTPGTSGYGGDGGGATGGFLNKPTGLAFDSAGNLYIADTGNNVIRKVAASTSVITTYAGSFAKSFPNPSYTGDGGPALNAGLYVPVGLFVDSGGNLYIADSGNNVVRKVSTNLIISTVAGNGTAGFSGDGARLPTLSQLSHPKGVAVDAAGNVYIADTLNSRIRVVSPNGASINTVIGSGVAAYYGDGNTPLQAGLNFPSGLSFDSNGNLIIADTNNGAIRKFAPGAAGGSKPSIASGGVITASQFGAYGTISPGVWIEIYGSNLASTTTDWSKLFQGNNAPTNVGGTTVTIGGIPAYIDYVSPGQVNAQVPSNLTTGTQQLVVSTAAGQSANYSVNVQPTSAGLLSPSLTFGGKSYVGAFHSADNTLVTPSSPAKVGETIILYGVGFGPVTPAPAAGQLVQSTNSLTTPVTFFFGAAQANTSYFGEIPGYLGLYQFNVVVPNVASNSAVPLTFILGSNNSTQQLFTAVQ
jgi:uncharacterized protein (TIGR03437 family)